VHSMFATPPRSSARLAYQQGSRHRACRRQARSAEFASIAYQQCP
jgi:hypothetical protein